MARAGRSWEFLALATKLVQPDPQTSLLISASFARLGLGSLALETFAQLPSTLQASPSGTNLKASIAKLPSDLIPLSHREDLVRQNLASLAARGVDLHPSFDAWRDHASRSETFLAYDANLVRRSTHPTDHPGLHLADHRALATGLIAQAPALRLPMPPPIVLEGIDPPWMLMAAFEATAPRPTAYAPRFSIIQEDTLAFLDALSVVDLSPLWQHPRLELFVGPGAIDRFADAMRSRVDTLLDPLVLTSAPAPSIPLRRAIEGALHAQREELTRLIASTDAMYAPSSLQRITQRFQAAARGEVQPEPLRILIPTSRYTTFVQHSASDLAAALRRAGHIAEILIEPSDAEQMSTLAYRRAIERLHPDLVVLVNYPRATLEGAFPQSLPYACWIQDAMPHLFDARIGAAQGPLDFTFGYTFSNLFDTFAYPVDRAMPAAVVADTAKFHDGPIDPTLLERHECEIAMVTHHSETPDAMHARLLRDMTSDPGIRAAMERIRVSLPAIVETALTLPASPRVAAIVERAAKDAMGPGVPAKSIEQLTRHYAMPMVDRIFRHQTLEWAAELCRERSWRLHLYGKGWHTHPTLAPFARGELAHAEELRAAYRAPRVHLHAGLCSLVHQRVMECALSGGLCLARTSFEALAPYHALASVQLVQHEPDHIDQADRLGYSPDNHAALRERLDLHTRLGIPTTPGLHYMPRNRVEAFRRKASIPSDAVSPTALFGDLALTTFWSRDTFRQRMVQAVENQAWREQLRTEIRDRVLERFTYDALVPRLLNLLAKGLATATTSTHEQAA
jgi:hypothetical protein